MQNYSDNLYNIQKQYVKQVNLMLKDNLQSDFKKLYELLKQKGHTKKDRHYSISDGKENVWIKSTSSYKKEILIETQSCLYIVELRDFESKPEMFQGEKNEFFITYIPYEEAEKKYYNIENSVRIYHWHHQEDLEFGLTVCNRNEIICYFKAINTFLINWDSLHCCLINNLGDYDEQ